MENYDKFFEDMEDQLGIKDPSSFDSDFDCMDGENWESEYETYCIQQNLAYLGLKSLDEFED